MRAARKLLIGLVATLAVGLAGYFFRYDIHDWLKLRDYTPSSAIVSLADKTTMLPSSRRLFYVNHPVVADKQTFNSFCRRNEHSIVLGCYLPGQRGIYLLSVEDERLAGIEEVTAAHELLHAAYERLSKRDHEWVNQQLNAVYGNIKDPRIIETVESYRKQDPTVVLNEMHSIFGTEVLKLPGDLEEYYARYFSDRHQIVKLADKYEQAFTDRRNKIRQLDLELESLKVEIDSSSLTLRQKDNALKVMRSRMGTYRLEGNAGAYNELVPQYNSQVAQYNKLIDEVSSSIVRYNALVQERNEISSEEADLVKSIDSRDIIPEDR